MPLLPLRVKREWYVYFNMCTNRVTSFLNVIMGEYSHSYECVRKNFQLSTDNLLSHRSNEAKLKVIKSIVLEFVQWLMVILYRPETLIYLCIMSLKHDIRSCPRIFDNMLEEIVNLLKTMLDNRYFAC
jgi:hypothetical protein